ncbi:MAG: Calx-beta domain-containing protein, partial [Chloroflexota bacterium]
LFGSGFAEIVIIDNDNALPWIYFEFADYAIYEDMDNDPATASELAVTVRLSHAVADDVTVTVMTSNNTAAAPGDFQAIDQEITIPAGSRDAVITLSINEDGIPERPETFLVVFGSTPTGAIVDPTQSSTTVTIADGTPPTIRINDLATIQQVAAANSTATFKLQLDGNVILPVRFNIAVQNQFGSQPILRNRLSAAQWHQLNPGTNSFAYKLPFGIVNSTAGSVDDPLFEANFVGLNGAIKGGPADVVVVQGFEERYKLFLPFSFTP